LLAEGYGDGVGGVDDAGGENEEVGEIGEEVRYDNDEKGAVYDSR
jgi:hypothetical protein